MYCHLKEGLSKFSKVDQIEKQMILKCIHSNITNTKSKLDKNIYYKTSDDVNCEESSSVHGVYMTIVDKLYASEKDSLIFSTVTEIYNSNINEIEGLGEGINSDRTNDKINTHIYFYSFNYLVPLVIFILLENDCYL